MTRLAVAQCHSHGAVVAAAARRIVGRQYPPESFSEFSVEYGVDDRIEGGIRIAQPGQHFKRHSRYAGFTERGDDVDAEKRHPAQEERAHDDADSDGGLVVGHVIR